MRWFIDRGNRWHRWFAWYPVRIGEDWLTRGPEIVWLEWVERHVERFGGFKYKTYRHIKAKERA